MTRKKAAAVVLILTALCAPQCMANKEKMKPGALLAWARSEESLRAANVPPLLMRAELDVSGSHGGSAKGGYVLVWVSPSQWREEIKFKGYDRLRVGAQNGYWQTSTLNYRPEFVNQLEEMLYIERVTLLSEDETLAGIERRNKHGVKEDCTQVRSKFVDNQRLCFNVANGTLLSVDNPIMGISRIEYSQFNSVDGKIVPYETRALDSGGRVVADIKVTEIGELPQNIAGLFTAPPNAEFWDICEHMRQPKALKQPKPLFPSALRSSGGRGWRSFTRSSKRMGTSRTLRRSTSADLL